MLLIQVMQIQLERTTIKDNNRGRRHKQREKERVTKRERENRRAAGEQLKS